MEKKKWYLSKTLYVNALAMVGMVLAQYTDVTLDAETSVGILAVVNFVVRLITKSGLEA
jgi:hypothetical protein